MRMHMVGRGLFGVGMVLSVLLCGGCLEDVSTGLGDAGGGGGAMTSISSNAVPSQADGGGAQGTDCLTDETGQIILCAGISTCPGVAVDPGTFPDCGFRLQAGGGLDLECACSGSLCPIGVPRSCDDAQQLLASQSALVVCEQVSEERCLPFGPDAGSGGGAGSSASGTCDRGCESECAGAPTCIQLCGC